MGDAQARLLARWHGNRNAYEEWLKLWIDEDKRKNLASSPRSYWPVWKNSGWGIELLAAAEIADQLKHIPDDIELEVKCVVLKLEGL
jgi:hypothetical protein